MRKAHRPVSSAPLLDWQPPLARQRRSRWPILSAIAGGLALIGSAAMLDFAVRPAPLLVWNASASAPIGLWRIRTGVPLRQGDMVLARMPPALASLAAERRYIPRNVPLLKRIAARNGDTVCALDNRIFVNADPVAVTLDQDRQGRRLPRWQGCELLHNGRIFLLMDRQDSFDGRYFGPVDGHMIIGKATPLWLR